MNLLSVVGVVRDDGILTTVRVLHLNGPLTQPSFSTEYTAHTNIAYIVFSMVDCLCQGEGDDVR